MHTLQRGKGTGPKTHSSTGWLPLAGGGDGFAVVLASLQSPALTPLFSQQRHAVLAWLSDRGRVSHPAGLPPRSRQLPAQQAHW